MPWCPFERHSGLGSVDSEVLERSLKTCGLAGSSLRGKRCLDALSYLVRTSSQGGTSDQPPHLNLWVKSNEFRYNHSPIDSLKDIRFSMNLTTTRDLKIEMRNMAEEKGTQA